MMGTRRAFDDKKRRGARRGDTHRHTQTHTDTHTNNVTTTQAAWQRRRNQTATRRGEWGGNDGPRAHEAQQELPEQ